MIAAQELHAFCQAAMAATGAPAEHAALVADHLVESELQGVTSHGVRRLPTYARRVRNGQIRAGVEPTVVSDRPLAAVLDGQNGLGMVNAHRAMTLALQKARVHGVGMAAVRSSNHLGRAGHYAELALAEGAIGFCLTNASGRMAPWGGAEPWLGNNPWSVAIPAGEEPPVVVDMANTVSANGKIRAALAAGERIPAGWALDRQGNPTTDPAAALAGFPIPIGGAKGYALSLIVDLLTGVLSGGEWGPRVYNMDSPQPAQNTCHLLMAIHVDLFMPAAEFKGRVDAYVRELRTVRPAPGGEPVRAPGERGHRLRQRQLRDGITLEPATLAALERLGAELAIPLQRGSSHER